MVLLGKIWDSAASWNMTFSVGPTDSNDPISNKMLKGADVRVNRGQEFEIYRKRRRDVDSGALAMTTFNLASSIPRPLKRPRASTRKVYVEDIQLHSLGNELKT